MTQVTTWKITCFEGLKMNVHYNISNNTILNRMFDTFLKSGWSVY
jgi:hypothetical protein